MLSTHKRRLGGRKIDYMSPVFKTKLTLLQETRNVEKMHFGAEEKSP